MSEEAPPQVTVKLDWADADAAPTQHVNQILGQIGAPTGSGVPDGIYVTFGAVMPPVIPADEAERTRVLNQLAESPVKVQVHSRVHMSREMLDDFIQVLQRTASQYDAATERTHPRVQPTGIR